VNIPVTAVVIAPSPAVAAGGVTPLDGLVPADTAWASLQEGTSEDMEGHPLRSHINITAARAIGTPLVASALLRFSRCRGRSRKFPVMPYIGFHGTKKGNPQANHFPVYEKTLPVNVAQIKTLVVLIAEIPLQRHHPVFQKAAQGVPRLGSGLFPFGKTHADETDGKAAGHLKGASIADLEDGVKTVGATGLNRRGRCP